MARIAFAQNLAFEYMGVMYLSAALKKNGHEVEVFLGNGDERLAREIAEFRPDLLAFSCFTGSEAWCVRMAALVKERVSVKVMLGGPHPTFFPDIIREKPVDIICRGEGDEAIVDIAAMLERRVYATDVANCWFSVDGRIVTNDPRPLVEDLDRLPCPDRELYRKKYPYLRTDHLVVFTGRGCPFDCTYCFNKSLKEIYRDKGRYVRKRSADGVIDEIAAARARSPVKTVYFQDDTFFFSKQWLSEFAVKYAERIGIPYICLMRAEQADEESVALLKASNCRRVFFGVESGSERLRFTVLHRHIPDAQLVGAGLLLKRYRMPFRTYNMLGLPGETIEDAFKTVAINTAMKTDYPWCSLFYPYPGTELGSQVMRSGLLLRDAEEKGRITFFRKSHVRSAHTDEFSNLQKLFYYAVKFPALHRVIKRLMRLRPNIAFDLLFLISYGWCYMRSERRGPVEMIRTGLRSVGTFYFGSG